MKNLFASSLENLVYSSAKTLPATLPVAKPRPKKIKDLSFEEKFDLIFDTGVDLKIIADALTSCSKEELERIGAVGKFYRRLASSDAWLMSDMSYTQALEKAWICHVADGMASER